MPPSVVLSTYLSFGQPGQAKPLIEPKTLYKQCLEQGVPTDNWLRKANGFENPLGRGPARGMVLMLRRDYDAIDHNQAQQLVWQTGNSPAITFDGLNILRAKCCDPGGQSDLTACYYVEVVDARHQWGRIVCGRRYNMVTSDGADYTDDSLHGDLPWTWEEILEELWNMSILDGSSVPTLEESPHGIPENFNFMESYALDALCVLLDRLGYALRWIPHADTNKYRIVRLGSDTLVENIDLNLEAPDQTIPWIWDDYPLRPTVTWVPSNVKVYFRITPNDCDEEQYCIVTVPRVKPVPGELEEVREDGTSFIIHDDLMARRPAASGSGSTSVSGSFCSGSISGSYCPGMDGCCAFTNADVLQARACERAKDFYRMITKSSTPFHRVYSEARRFVPQAKYKSTHLQEWGQGVKTTVYRGNDLLPPFGAFEEWYKAIRGDLVCGGANAGGGSARIFGFCFEGPIGVITHAKQVCCDPVNGMSAEWWYIVYNPLTGCPHYFNGTEDGLQAAKEMAATVFGFEDIGDVPVYGTCPLPTP